MTCVLCMPCISGSPGQRRYQLGSEPVCLVYLPKEFIETCPPVKGILGTHSQTRTAGKTMQDSCPTFRNGNLTFALLLYCVMRNVLHLAYFWIMLCTSPFWSNTEIPGSDSVNPPSFCDCTRGHSF